MSESGPGPTTVDRLRGLDAATVHDAAGRTGQLAPRIRPVLPGVTLAGRVTTAACRPGDNLAAHRAVAAANDGDVLVVTADGDLAGYWGEVLTVAAQARGIAGLVLDGGCRDTAALRRRGFPVWAAGVTVAGTVHVLPGLVNEPVLAGGVVVHPGDFVIADDDGVVVVPAARIDEVLDAATARAAREQRLLRGLVAGATTIELLGLLRVEADTAGGPAGSDAG
ncbi:4-carboxy-4-hydroxy-2-oxoadipate aldolase/oxaloacetate decarboxylase [Micromonospora sp. HUAS LYJ1]|uniref:4-carboxy-4-hydroxy-2-oxoadipate aldolase/oxaloacetate decarboxylase n=1 Tax=Micromonospora sp. HUAS LYJ1 TaxID=3061626 RepID=UPI00267192AE|nr:4-carboxy-4-hydroxy-2-oxoadipate aldolase/oxaloacetate decarboxylase [Micromonospora sp. HUAS LYJ1]WKU07137.1 4-carboxy-4-hydroxy-2-oxoadipate aldolase/oxaloacetate decarboxylase [Micromonospora sp. HUAS LYJ1]